jgi:hypothetical protein
MIAEPSKILKKIIFLVLTSLACIPARFLFYTQELFIMKHSRIGKGTYSNVQGGFIAQQFVEFAPKVATTIKSFPVDRRSQKGQSFVELALVVVFLMIFVAGIVEFGFALNNYLNLVDASRESVRYSSNFDPFILNPDGTKSLDQNFFDQTFELTEQVLDPVVLDPSNGDDIVVSFFSVADGYYKRYPEDSPGRSRYLNQVSKFSNADIQSRLDSSAPPTGVLLVEIFYHYNQVLKLPVFTAFVRDPMPLYVYATMPLTAAEPLVTYVPGGGGGGGGGGSGGGGGGGGGATSTSVATATPVNTSTPVNTATATEIPANTPTNTPSPVHIEFVLPDSSGVVITASNLEETRFEAIAWNPPYGTSNGDGIDNIEFWFGGPGSIPGATERVVAYCAFTGDTPCTRLDQRVDYSTLPDGTYTIYARAQGVDGRYSETISRNFILSSPPTPTATASNTPTPTATSFVCNVSGSNFFLDGNDVLAVDITNNTDQTLHYANLTIFFNASSPRRQRLQSVQNGGATLWSGSTSSSPRSVSSQGQVDPWSTTRLRFQFSKNYQFSGVEHLMLEFEENGCQTLDVQ